MPDFYGNEWQGDEHITYKREDSKTMKFIKGVVLKEEVKERSTVFPGNDVPVISYIHELTVRGVDPTETSGQEETLKIGKFEKTQTDLAGAGAEVKIVYSSKAGSKGQIFHTIEKNGLEVLCKQPPREASNDFVEGGVSTRFTGATGDNKTPNIYNQTVQKPTQKDVSMEVSGLLQALINSGTAIEDLEGRLRAVLDLKRKVAKDYE